MRIDLQDCEGWEVIMPNAIFIGFLAFCALYIKTINQLKPEQQNILWFFLAGINCLWPGAVIEAGRKWQLMLYFSIVILGLMMLGFHKGLFCIP